MHHRSLPYPYSIYRTPIALFSLTASNCGLGANLEEDVEKIHGCDESIVGWMRMGGRVVV